MLQNTPIIVMKRTGHSGHKAMMPSIDMEDAFKAESMTKFIGLFKNNDYLRVNNAESDGQAYTALFIGSHIVDRR